MLKIVIFLIVTCLLSRAIGEYMWRVLDGRRFILSRYFRSADNLACQCCSVNKHYEMDWQEYLISILLFNGVGILLVFLVLVFQNILPLNQFNVEGMKIDKALNIAISFVTNTDWQPYNNGIEMTYFSQMFALTTQNFLSAVTGLSVFVALTRSFIRKETDRIGNFWIDSIRGTIYVFLPLAIILAILLIWQGIPQTLEKYQIAHILLPYYYGHGNLIDTQIIPLGPAASQVAIKQLGTNGGGFFSTNSANPFENPTPLSNLMETIAIMVIPMASCFTFGFFTKNKKHAVYLFITLISIFLSAFLFETYYEHLNMIGKETRIGLIGSTLWTIATSVTSNGSMNSALSSYTPIGGMIPVVMMHFGETIFGGVGLGMCNILVYMILTVFIGGLMIGKTPEYLGKKIEVFEMKMSSIFVLIPQFTILLATMITVFFNKYSISVNSNTHRFSEILYNITSVFNNNGLTFCGLSIDNIFYNYVTSIVMLIGRYLPIAIILMIAGSIVKKKSFNSSNNVDINSCSFMVLFAFVLFVFGVLTFFPALCIGPIYEQLSRIVT